MNPRERNKRNFRDIVDNIAQLGLKKPITVSRRVEAGSPFYDLVAAKVVLRHSRHSANPSFRPSWCRPTRKTASSQAWLRTAPGSSITQSTSYRHPSNAGARMRTR